MTEVTENVIHETAVVSPAAEIASDVTVGPGAIVEAGAVIGSGCKIGSNTLITSGARLGENITVHHGAVVGSAPQDLKFAGEETLLTVGSGTEIREYATLNRGTVESGETRVGENCLLMAYVHVAHDCQIGNNVILANAIQMGGHVEIGDHAIIGGGVTIHQFVHIGQHVMIGGGFRTVQDVCPYALVGGYPLRIAGANLIGLRRRKFKREVIHSINSAYKLLFFSDLNTSQAVERIKDEVELIPEVQNILSFIEHSTRGLVK